MQLDWTGRPQFAGQLGQGGLDRLDLSRGSDARIACVRGRLWITREGDREDYLLRAGETDIFEGRGRVVLEALEEAAFTIERRRARGRLRGGLENLREILRSGKGRATKYP
ncbi:MAG: hypothetical protein K0Q91_406 [Fibrobacteria bacterium]|jgi:hypothetical protein|nr:hypothetical protein [Fibrobacteria bacterium]